MGGFFGTISQQACKADLFYGTDYNSHLGTRRAGMATYDPQRGFIRKIHSLRHKNCSLSAFVFAEFCRSFHDIPRCSSLIFFVFQ